jgi:hypothetical protein
MVLPKAAMPFTSREKPAAPSLPAEKNEARAGSCKLIPSPWELNDDLTESKEEDFSGGEGGIRTPDTLSGMPVFKTGYGQLPDCRQSGANFPDARFSARRRGLNLQDYFRVREAYDTALERLQITPLKPAVPIAL